MPVLGKEAESERGSTIIFFVKVREGAYTLTHTEREREVEINLPPNPALCTSLPLTNTPL